MYYRLCAYYSIDSLMFVIQDILQYVSTHNQLYRDSFDCSLKKRFELPSGITALLKMVDEHFSSVSFVLIITAQTVDAEDHSMDDASKQPRWVA